MDEQVIVKDSGSSGMSNTTIIVLVVLAVMITIIGTWAVMNSAVPSRTQGLEESNTNVGIVTLTILPPPQSDNDSSAKIALDVS